MGDGAGIVTDADAAIEGGIAKPDRTFLLSLIQHFPESHMMAAIGASADRLLEREVFVAAEIEQRTDGRVVVRPVQQHAARNLDRRSQRHGIGRIPAGRPHGAEHVELVADQADIDGIAGNALRGARHHRQISKAALMFVVVPQRRQRQIGQRQVGQYDAERDEQALLQSRMRVMGRQYRQRKSPWGSGLCVDASRLCYANRFPRFARKRYRRVSRQPAASASSTEQNQRVPLLIFISILAYQRLVGL